MPFDYKKEYKEFYLPPGAPVITDIPAMNFVAVQGSGDPNAEDGEYKRAIGVLYAVSYTLKMSRLGGRRIEGYFDYVVPPLEGLWMTGGHAFDYFRKDTFRWVSMIRLPDFVTEADFLWAAAQAESKKKVDCSAARFFSLTEGPCVQCMHVGRYDDEPATISAMHDYAAANGYALDVSDARPHHEIYLGDPRRTKPENLRTVIRLPVKQL